MSCDKDEQIVHGTLIPDAVVLLLAFWVYCVLKLSDLCHLECYEKCCKCFGWKELNTVLKADTAKSLNELVKKVQSKICISRYIIISILYIFLSQGSGVMYLYAFRLLNNDVLHSPIMGTTSLTGKAKLRMIIFSLIGFVAFDLLYIRVIMRYAYRCQLNIYYLQKIENNIDDYKEMEEGQDRERRQKTIMKKVEKAREFIKKLNTSSATTGFVILIAGFTATNCAIDLLRTDITYFQAGAIFFRLILWTFIAIFPFHKAAGVNITSKKLYDTSLIICRLPNALPGYSHESISYCSVHFNLKAKLFGIFVRSWLSYVILILLLLSIMIGSQFKWYDHLL